MYRNGCSGTSSASICEGKESFYKKMLELQDKLRKSEEERIRLEERFKLLAEESRIRHQACINRLRMRYVEFLEEQRARDERNGKLLNALDRVDNSLVLMTAKTERLNLLRKQYEEHLLRGYANQAPQQQYHLQRHQPQHQRPAAGSTTADSGLESQNEPETARTSNPAHTSRSTPVIPRLEPPPSPPRQSLISSEPCVLSSYRLPVSSWDSVSRRLDFHLADRRPSLATLTSLDPPGPTGPILEQPVPVAASTPEDDLDPLEALRKLSFLSPSARPSTGPQQKLDGYISRIREQLEHESRESSEQNTSGDLLNASPLSEDEDAVAGQRGPSFATLRSFNLDDPQKTIQQNRELLAQVEAEESPDNEIDGIEDDYDHSVDIDSWMPDDQDLDVSEQPAPARSEPRLRPRTKLESIEEVEPPEDEEQPDSGEAAVTGSKTPQQQPDVDEFDLRLEEMNARSRRSSVLRQQQVNQLIEDSKRQEDQQQRQFDQEQVEHRQDSIDQDQPVGEKLDQEYSEQISQQQYYKSSENQDQQQPYEFFDDVDKKQTDDSDQRLQQQHEDSNEANQQLYQNPEDPNQQQADQQQYVPQQYQYSEDPNQPQPDREQYQYSEDLNQSQTDQQQYQYLEDSSQSQVEQQQYQYSEDPNQQQYQYSEDPNQQQYQYSEDLNQEQVDQQQYQYSGDPNQQYAYDTNAAYSGYENQQYAEGQYTEYSEQQYQQYDQEYQQHEYADYHQQSQQIGETGSEEQQADNYSQAYAHGSDPVQSTAALDHSQSEHVTGGAEHPEKVESAKTTSGSSRPVIGTADKPDKSKEKKKDVIASILDSDSESLIERNLSNTESDFDFN